MPCNIFHEAVRGALKKMNGELSKKIEGKLSKKFKGRLQKKIKETFINQP